MADIELQDITPEALQSGDSLWGNRSNTVKRFNVANVAISGSASDLTTGTLPDARLSTTSVSANTYGSASAVGTFTVDENGRLTDANTINISITTSEITDAGSLATQDANNVTITGGDISGITDLAIADGGTGASTAAAARSNLEVGALHPGLNEQTGTSYTLVLSDAGKVVTMDNAANNDVTVPTNASVAFPSGASGSTIINIVQKGAGTTTVTGDAGVTINGTSGGSVEISDQYQGVSLLKIDTDTWLISGSIV